MDHPTKEILLLPLYLYMSLQLFGRDQINVDYDHSDNAFWSVYGSPTESDRLSQRLINWLDKSKNSIKQVSRFRVCRIPVTHLLVLITWILILLRFTSYYRKLYGKSALLATISTNILLFGISDSMAQCILSYFSTHVDPLPQVIDDMMDRFCRPHMTDDSNDSDDLSVFNDYGEPLNDENDYNHDPLYDPSAPNAHIFDFFRWLCFIFWGIILSFFQVPWYKFLNYFYTEDPTVIQVLERVLSDQLLYSPISLYCFFAYSNYVMEGGNAETFSKKVQVLYMSTLGCNFLVWPLVQFVNFLLVSKHFQVPFSSSVGILWNCFLSMRNASNSIN